MLAITQPLRIGDLVTFEDQTGTVEDVRLTYTWLRMGNEARLVIPNERLAAGILRNDSIRSATVALEVTVWLAPDADETRRSSVLEALEDARDGAHRGHHRDRRRGPRRGAAGGDRRAPRARGGAARRRRCARCARPARARGNRVAALQGFDTRWRTLL